MLFCTTVFTIFFHVRENVDIDMMMLFVADILIRKLGKALKLAHWHLEAKFTCFHNKPRSP